MKKDRPVMPGLVVRSKAGRDEGRYFIVTALEGTEFAFVADGDTHKIEKPKRKRIKHLFVTEEINPGLQGKLQSGLAVENHELRKALAAFKQKEA